MTAKLTQAEVIRVLLADVNVRVTETEAKLADLHSERRGLELSLARLTAETVEADKIVEPWPAGDDHTALHSTHQVPEEWQSLGKTAAVKRVLEEATEPLGPADIVATLNSVGLLQEDSESVRGALAYLKRKGEANFVGRSQWVLVGGAVHQRLREEKQNPTDTEAPVAARASGTATTSGLGGEDHEAQDHRHDLSRWNGVYHSGAPVGGPN